MKCRWKSIVFVVIVAFYMLITITHCFFSRTNFNKILSAKVIFAHFYSFTVLFGCVIALVLVVALALTVYKHGYKNLYFCLLSLALITSVILIVFGVNPTKNIDTHEGNTIKIVEWNVENELESKSIYKIFGEFDADIMVFPELEGYYKGDPANNRLKELFKSINIAYDKYEVFTSIPTSGNIAPVTIVIKKSFSKYIDTNQSLMTQFGTIYLKSIDKDMPDIIGLHTAPPLLGLMSNWNRDLNVISSNIVESNPKAIILGDFNATLRHGALNSITTHEDVLDYLSRFRRGTWHSNFPIWMSTSIDHILIPKDTYRVKKVDVLKLRESDHRAIFVEISK